MLGPVAPGSGFLTLCLQRVDLHARQRLACGHEVAFLHQDIGHAATVLGGNVHFGGFDAAVAVDQAGAFLRALPLLPAIHPQRHRSSQHGGNDQWFFELGREGGRSSGGRSHA
ncbi:hypothetical protein SDC9_117397 [bioreactor metagenome]|uniref:Uncharacterized protein n=1 Tax=bioreactor metagenome TaxID=1076179 RepID=A0A645BYM6_9ZZZZ